MSNVRFHETDASVLLDLLRGAAAVLVVLEHWRNFLFVDYPNLGAKKALLTVPYLVASAGHQAVIIFFVLSGYLISGSIFRSLKKGDWGWLNYLFLRVSRLWIVLVPGLLLCSMWDRAGLRSGWAPKLYHGAGANHMTGDVAHTLGLTTFLQNCFFLQGFRAPVFGSDGALWSLSNEFWYYLLFPLALVAFNKKTRASQKIINLLLFAAIVVFIRGSVLFLFPIWLLGSLLCVVPTPVCSQSQRKIALILYLPSILFFAKQKVISPLVADYLLAIVTFILVWILLSAKEKSKPSLYQSSVRELARFSYTLYIVHMPFLAFITAAVVGDSRWFPTGMNTLLAILILGTVVLYAYGVAVITEFKTDSWRSRVSALLHLPG